MFSGWLAVGFVLYRVCGVIFAALIAGALAACAAVDETIDNRFDSIDRSAGKARNESVLRNIARASQRIPLTFMAFSKVSGGLSANVSSSLPTFAIGPQPLPTQVQRDVVISNSTLGGSTTASNAVDFAVLESNDFYHALLDPGDLIDFHTLIQQGYPRELLFWLFADSVRITIIDTSKPRSQPEYWELRNRVDERESCQDIPGIGHLCFKDMVDLAMITGLSVQVKPGDETESSGRRSAKSDGDSSKAAKQKIYSRLCLDPFFSRQTAVFITQSRKDYSPSPALRKLRLATQTTPANLRTYCGQQFKVDPKNPPKLEMKSLMGGRRYIYEIKTRSTFAIYQFLGRILAERAFDRVLMTGLEPDTADQRQILSINVDHATDCAVSTTLRGITYCVPERGSEITKLIFNLLTQLIALKTQSKDLGITPTVRVSPF